MKKAVTFLLLLAACTAPENIDYDDRDAKLTRTDYREMLTDRPPAAPKATIPDFVPVQESIPARKQSAIAQQRVTLSLDGTTSLQSVFQELARKAKLNLDMDPGINAPAPVFEATEEPLADVVDQLADQAGLRATIKGKMLTIKPDAPYIDSYRIEYPNIARATRNNISSSLNIAKSEGNESKNDSALNSDSKSVSDFWEELAGNIAQLLQINATAPVANSSTNFSINRQAGLITIKGTQRQHRMIAEYLDKLKESAQAQVLIEARILEVSLNDSFSSGINWNTMLGGAFELGFNAPAGFPAARQALVPNGLPGVSLNVTGEDFDGLFNFLQNFGTVRALSSPRMTVMQNQVGVIKVVRNEVYFRLLIQTTDATINSPQRRDVTSEQRTVPVGLIMNVQPSIDKETGRITLALRPTITRIADYRTDPGILIAASDAGLAPSQISSAVPIVAVQEMDSVVALQSGQTLVMGGLMRDTTTATTDGIPGTAEVPLVRYLANAREDSTSKSELVVFLKATIVGEPQATIHPTDRDLYYGMGRDRRPINADATGEEE